MLRNSVVCANRLRCGEAKFSGKDSAACKDRTIARFQQIVAPIDGPAQRFLARHPRPIA